jgi:hypothetical protein
MGSVQARVVVPELVKDLEQVVVQAQAPVGVPGLVQAVDLVQAVGSVQVRVVDSVEEGVAVLAMESELVLGLVLVPKTESHNFQY